MKRPFMTFVDISCFARLMPTDKEKQQNKKQPETNRLFNQESVFSTI